MTGTTRTFGLLLIALGVIGYLGTGRTSMTALIPAYFGAAFLVCSIIARQESARKHAMHAAVAIGLLGAIAALARALPAAMNGQAGRPAVLAPVAVGAVLLVSGPP